MTKTCALFALQIVTGVVLATEFGVYTTGELPKRVSAKSLYAHSHGDRSPEVLHVIYLHFWFSIFFIFFYI